MRIQKVTPGSSSRPTTPRQAGASSRALSRRDDDIAYEDEKGDAVDWREKEDAFSRLSMVQPTPDSRPTKAGQTVLIHKPDKSLERISQ